MQSGVGKLKFETPLSTTRMPRRAGLFAIPQMCSEPNDQVVKGNAVLRDAEDYLFRFKYNESSQLILRKTCASQCAVWRKQFVSASVQKQGHDQQRRSLVPIDEAMILD
jgi:hypothetical protein